MTEPHPDANDIRAALLARSEAFSRLTGVAISSIAKSSVNDPAFFSQVAKGRNFTIDTYTKVMAWLDANWPAEAPSPALAASPDQDTDQSAGVES